MQLPNKAIKKAKEFEGLADATFYTSQPRLLLTPSTKRLSMNEAQLLIIDVPPCPRPQGSESIEVAFPSGPLT